FLSPTENPRQHLTGSSSDAGVASGGSTVVSNSTTSGSLAKVATETVAAAAAATVAATVGSAESVAVSESESQQKPLVPTEPSNQSDQQQQQQPKSALKPPLSPVSDRHVGFNIESVNSANAVEMLERGPARPPRSPRAPAAARAEPIQLILTIKLLIRKVSNGLNGCRGNTTIVRVELEFNSLNYTLMPMSKGLFVQIVCLCPAKTAEMLLSRLVTLGIGRRHNTSVNLFNPTVSRTGRDKAGLGAGKPGGGSGDDDDDEADGDEGRMQAFMDSMRARLMVSQVYRSVMDKGRWTFDFVCFLVCATIIAAVGLATNSSVMTMRRAIAVAELSVAHLPLAARPTSWPAHWPAGWPVLNRPAGWPVGWPAQWPVLNRPAARPTSWPAHWPAGWPVLNRPAGWPAGWPAQWSVLNRPAARPTSWPAHWPVLNRPAGWPAGWPAQWSVLNRPAARPAGWPAHWPDLNRPAARPTSWPAPLSLERLKELDKKSVAIARRFSRLKESLRQTVAATARPTRAEASVSHLLTATRTTHDVPTTHDAQTSNSVASVGSSWQPALATGGCSSGVQTPMVVEPTGSQYSDNDDEDVSSRSIVEEPGEEAPDDDYWSGAPMALDAIEQCDDCEDFTEDDRPPEDEDVPCVGNGATHNPEAMDMQPRRRNGAALFLDSPLTYDSFAAYVHLFSERQSLPRKGIADLLRLFHAAVPVGSNLPGSVYLLRKTVQAFANDFTSPPRLFCSSCSAEVTSAQAQNRENCTYCNKELSPAGVSKFYTTDFKLQIRQLIEQCRLLQSVTFPVDLSSEDRNFVSVSSCDEYRHFKRSVRLHLKQDLSYTVNIDGFPVFADALMEMCPVYLSINEVHEAMKSRFIVVCGFWAAKSKVKTSTFLPGLVRELNELRSIGITYSTGGGTEGDAPGLLRLHPYLFVLDAPQRAEVVGLKRHNAEFGCDNCYVKTQRSLGANRYPVSGKEEAVALATAVGCITPHARSLRDTRLLAHNIPVGKDNYLGVMCVSVLDQLNGFDYMH
uniref:Guanylate cyclase domain-containing protein n=1 Tax=Macrostomum lignano TaxID=282301 RepID=A0A1I8IJ21_9PLAT